MTGQSMVKLPASDDTIETMKQGEQTVVVIGGGATGTGITRELSRRGHRVILIERSDLGSGTSGHFHGMLHSGARYAVNDPLVAADCYKENQRLRQLIPSAITDTGGMFVALNAEEAEHAKVVMQACKSAGIPVTEITPQEALHLEPRLSPNVTAAFLVPDGFIDGTELIRLNKESALSAKNPAKYLTGYNVTGFQIEANRILAVSVRHSTSDDVEHIPCDQVINAAGVWAGQITKLVSIDLEMVFDKGTMIVFKDKFSKRVINRCRPEADGDLLVPRGAQSVMGTTSRVITNPNDNMPTQEEVDALLNEGMTMIPAMQSADVEEIYAGVRPLLEDHNIPSGTRSISRSFRVIDHSDEGVDNFISVVGGKITLFRHMSEIAADSMESKK